VFTASALDATPTYKVTYESGGHKHFYINGTEVGTACGETFTPVEGQTNEETQDDDDQAPGHVSGHELFNNTQVQSSTGGVHDFWESGSTFVDGVIGSPGTWFKKNQVGSQRSDQWDGDCS
jgi:hypothetical protein